jgi:hypothetical protein
VPHGSPEAEVLSEDWNVFEDSAVELGEVVACFVDVVELKEWR